MLATLSSLSANIEYEHSSFGVVQAIHVVRVALPEKSHQAQRDWLKRHSKELDLPGCSFERAGRPSLAVNCLRQVTRILDVACVSALSGGSCSSAARHAARHAAPFSLN